MMPNRREIIEHFIPNSPHSAQLGIEVISLGTDGTVVAHGIATYRFG